MAIEPLLGRNAMKESTAIFGVAAGIESLHAEEIEKYDLKEKNTCWRVRKGPSSPTSAWRSSVVHQYMLCSAQRVELRPRSSLGSRVRSMIAPSI
jgi:hypothetical protein